MGTADGRADTATPLPRAEDLWARRAALAVAFFGLFAVVVPAALHIERVFRDDPFEARTRTVVVVREVDGRIERETTTSPEDQPVLDRALASGGLLLLRIGVVALASFLAGATVQRIIASDFSGKFGPLELRKLSRTAALSSTAVRDLMQGLQDQKEVTQRIAAITSAATKQLTEALQDEKAATRRTAAIATRTARRLRELETRIDDTPMS